MLDLIERLEIDLDEQKETDLNLWIDDKIEAIDIARSNFYNRHMKYLYNWDDFVTFNRKGPWDGCFLPGTDLLTKRGWVAVENVTLEDKVLSRNPKTGETGFKAVEKVWAYSSTPFSVRFFNDTGLDISVTPGHRIYLLDERSGKLPNRHCFETAGKFLDPKFKKQKKKWGLPRNGEYVGGELPHLPGGVEPQDWFTLWGWYLADGSWCQSTHGWIEISQSKKANPEKFAEIIALCNRLPFPWHEGKSGRYVRLKVPNMWRTAFASAGPQETRYIPRPLLEAPMPYLKVMFEAMMKGDGDKQGNHWRYATSSPFLASDVQELLVKIGKWGTIRKSLTKPCKIGNRPAYGGNRPFYTVSVHINERTNDFRVEKINYMGPSYCVSTQWGTVYARMNGKPLFIGQSANNHMPLTAIMVKTYHARLYNIFASEDAIQLTGREEFDEDHAKMIRRLYDWYLWDYLNEYKGIRSFTREVFYDTATVGFGIGMKDWYVKERKAMDIVPNELAREMTDLAPQVRENRESGAELETGEEMEKRSTKVKPYKEVLKVVKVFEGTRLRSIPFENAYFPNFIPGSSDLDFPPCVIIETEMSTSEIHQKVERGEWDKEKAQQVIDEQASTYSTSSQTRGSKVSRQRERLSGYNSDTVTYDKTPRLIQHAFCTYDIDGDNIDEEIIVTRSSKRNMIKQTYLDRVSRSGMRPLFKFDCFQKPRQAYARGIPEFMWPLNEEMDLTHNMRLNYLALQTAPFGTYRASSSLKSQPIRIAPGKFIPTDETTDMRVLNFQTNAVVLGAEEDRLWHYAERLASSSSLQQGIVPSTVGPTRSTSGVISLLQQMDKEFRPIVDGCVDSWKKLTRMILDDLDWRIEPAVKMKVLGASINDFIRPEKDLDFQIGVISDAMRINSQFDLKIDVVSIIRSDEVLKSEATNILGMLNSPSIAQQLGIVGPKALFKAYADWLKSYNRDPDDYLDMPLFIGKPMTFYQELQICYQEQLPPMAMQDDHAVKAQMLQSWLREPSYSEAKQKGLASPNSDEWIMKAAEKHMVLFKLLQPKGLPNQTGEQGRDFNEEQAGTAPQQGGTTYNLTTSRELPARKEQANGSAEGSRAGPEV